MQLEWDIPFALIPSVNASGTSPGLTGLPFNEPITLGTNFLGYFMLDPSKCHSGSPRRITRNNLAQADGEITHRKFKAGQVFELNAQLWENVNADPACAGTLREMADLLGEYLEAAANADAQLVWQPSGWPSPQGIATSIGEVGFPNPRLLDACRSMGPSGNDATGASFVSVIVNKDEGAKLVDVTFAFLSPYPYVTDFMNWPTSPDATVTFATDPVPPLGMGPAADATVTIYNLGTVAYYPRIHIYGPTLEFAITNFSILDETGRPLEIVWNGNIGSGEWVEIDCFHNTVYLNDGSGFLTNAKGGISVPQTDFFPLVPGPNIITIDKYLALSTVNYSGDQVVVYYRNAWE